jgi:hypothetical protein
MKQRGIASILRISGTDAHHPKSAAVKDDEAKNPVATGDKAGVRLGSWA